VVEQKQCLRGANAEIPVWEHLSLLKDLQSDRTQRQYLPPSVGCCQLADCVSNNHYEVAKICAQRAKTNSLEHYKYNISFVGLLFRGWVFNSHIEFGSFFFACRSACDFQGSVFEFILGDFKTKEYIFLTGSFHPHLS